MEQWRLQRKNIGQISVADTSAYALIDSGASHSAGKFVKQLDVKPEPLSQLFTTTTPSGEILGSMFCFHEIPVRVCDRVLPADLVVLDMRDFDVILGMDWLSRHKASCRSKSVGFRPPNDEVFTFRGLPMQWGAEFH